MAPRRRLSANVVAQASCPGRMAFVVRRPDLPADPAVVVLNPDVDVTPDANWRFYARYAQDRKDGTRASGGASSTPGTPFAETIEPIGSPNRARLMFPSSRSEKI